MASGGALRAPECLFDLVILRERASQQVEVVRQPVEVGQRVGTDRGVKCCCAQAGAFRAAADRAADVAQRDSWMAAGNREFGDRPHAGLHRVDALFQIPDRLGTYVGQFPFAAVPYGQQCGDAHQLRCDAVEVAEVFGQPLVRAQMVAQIGRETAQLVHRSVGFDPLVDLRHALAADERRRSLVSCFRIYFRHNLKCCFGNVPLKSSR